MQLIRETQSNILIIYTYTSRNEIIGNWKRKKEILLLANSREILHCEFNNIDSEDARKSALFLLFAPCYPIKNTKGKVLQHSIIWLNQMQIIQFCITLIGSANIFLLGVHITLTVLESSRIIEYNFREIQSSLQFKSIFKLEGIWQLEFSLSTLSLFDKEPALTRTH